MRVGKSLRDEWSNMNEGMGRVGNVKGKVSENTRGGMNWEGCESKGE